MKDYQSSIAAQVDDTDMARSPVLLSVGPALAVDLTGQRCAYETLNLITYAE
jgi:hypothetical protein